MWGLIFHHIFGCSVAKSRPAFCHPMDCSTTGFPVLHYLLEFAQTHSRCVNDAIQPSHPLLPPIFPSIRDFSINRNRYLIVSFVKDVPLWLSQPLLVFPHLLTLNISLTQSSFFGLSFFSTHTICDYILFISCI